MHYFPWGVYVTNWVEYVLLTWALSYTIFSVLHGRINLFTGCSVYLGDICANYLDFVFIIYLGTVYTLSGCHMTLLFWVLYILIIWVLDCYMTIFICVLYDIYLGEIRRTDYNNNRLNRYLIT